MPVDLDRAGNVADVVEQHVLIGFDDRQTGGAQMFGQPVAGDEALGVGVVLQGGIGIRGQWHAAKPTDHLTGFALQRSPMESPTDSSSRRVTDRPRPTTLDGSPSTASMNQPPSPSMVKPPAIFNGSPLAI